MERYDFIGNAGADAELEYSRTGKAVCKFSVAVPTGLRDPQGNRQVVWRKVEAWEKLAEICASYVRKGTKVYVCGTPKVEAWAARDGSGVKSALVCRAHTVELLARGDGQTSANAPAAAMTPQGYTPVEDDEDLPF